jgi:hypothetical protein
MVEGLLHEPGERLRPFCANRVTDGFNQRRVQLENVERVAINVQFAQFAIFNLRCRLETQR